MNLKVNLTVPCTWLICLVSSGVNHLIVYAFHLTAAAQSLIIPVQVLKLRIHLHLSSIVCFLYRDCILAHVPTQQNFYDFFIVIEGIQILGVDKFSASFQLKFIDEFSSNDLSFQVGSGFSVWN